MGKFELLFNLDKRIFDIYGKLLSIKRLPLLVKSRSLMKNNASLMNKRESDKCFLIGLGPSLKNIDLTKLDGDIIVTNRFYKIENAKEINPIAYVMCDNAYFQPKHLDDFKIAIESFPDTIFIVNGQYNDLVQRMYPFRDNIYYICLWDGSMSGNRKNLDCTKVLPMANNVVCAAIYVAIYMGYKEINLLGCDFNSFASQKNVHVYKDENENRLWTMSTELFQYSFAADSHIQLEQYTRLHGQKIYNLTDGSLIDAYERGDSSAFRVE